MGHSAPPAPQQLVTVSWDCSMKTCFRWPSPRGIRRTTSRRSPTTGVGSSDQRDHYPEGRRRQDVRMILTNTPPDVYFSKENPALWGS